MSVQARTVTEDEADIRLDRWFRRHFPGLQQSLIQKLCRTGQIRVDGARADTSTRLNPGQSVRVPPLPEPEAPKPILRVDPNDEKDLRKAILYQDEHIIALNKPYGLPVQGGPGITRHLDGMLDALRYWAVVAGRPVPVEGRIDMPLKKVGGNRGERMAPADRNDPDGQRAITDYRTLDHAARKLAWLELQPLTGRTHQLRVHCVALRAPILGDEKYEEPDQNMAFSALVEGLSSDLHLHARRLVLPHPRGGHLTVEADLPSHMAATFKTLGFHAPQAKPAGITR